jgi:hypothetical protein
VSAARRKPRSRLTYALLGIVVIVLGLTIRSPTVPVPAFVAKYAGDALWALLMFLGFGWLFPPRSTGQIAILAVAFSCAIEFSQLYHEPWIDDLRATWFGHLVLGDTFAWADIAAYLVGIACGAGAEAAVQSCTRLEGDQPV